MTKKKDNTLLTILIIIISTFLILHLLGANLPFFSTGNEPIIIKEYPVGGISGSGNNPNNQGPITLDLTLREPDSIDLIRRSLHWSPGSSSGGGDVSLSVNLDCGWGGSCLYKPSDAGTTGNCDVELPLNNCIGDLSGTKDCSSCYGAESSASATLTYRERVLVDCLNDNECLEGQECLSNECITTDFCIFNNVVCENKCDGNDFKYNGQCVPSTGECDYETQIDSSSCITTPECPDKIEGCFELFNGGWNPETQECTYESTRLDTPDCNKKPFIYNPMLIFGLILAIIILIVIILIRRKKSA